MVGRVGQVGRVGRVGTLGLLLACVAAGCSKAPEPDAYGNVEATEVR